MIRNVEEMTIGNRNRAGSEREGGEHLTHLTVFKYIPLYVRVRVCLVKLSRIYSTFSNIDKYTSSK
jgi:hypothetical protein